MRVRMLVDRTGTDDGRSYPPPPGEIDVPGDVGAAMCEHGWAQPVSQHGADVEKRNDPPAPPAPPAAQPPARPASEKPAVNAPKADWVAYAVGRGATSADAEAMTKEQLARRYG